jgi:hypothetical protein
MSKHIIDVTDDQVTTAAQAILEAMQSAEGGRTSYLRFLIVSTQSALGGKRGQDTVMQLTALAKVHARFYEIVMREAERYVPAGTKERQIEIHKKANFARTALSAVRSHIKTGADIVALNPDKTTKASLAKYQPATPAPANAKRLLSRAERFSKVLLATLMGLTEADPDAAAEEIRLVLGQLQQQLDEIADNPSDDRTRRNPKPEAHIPAPSKRQGRPPRAPFNPSETTVQRAQALPS